MKALTVIRLFLIPVLMAAQLCHGKVILEKFKATKEMTLRIDGGISLGDDLSLDAAIEKLKRSKAKLHMNAVQLNSDGGGLITSMKMGRIIREAGLNTYVGPDSSCASGCVMVLIGGVTRMAFGTVHVHRSHDPTDSIPIDKLKDNHVATDKAVETYFKEMGVSWLLFDAMATTPNWISREILMLEKRQWAVHGTGRYDEELILRRLANAKGITTGQLLDNVANHWGPCEKRAKAFEETMLECVAEKHWVSK